MLVSVVTDRNSSSIQVRAASGFTAAMNDCGQTIWVAVKT